jgi:SAM-dependent methyltransferase
LATDFKTLNTIVVLLGLKVTLSKTVIKLITYTCINSNIKVIFFDVNKLEYKASYLLEEPDNMAWVYRTLDNDLKESLEKHNIKGGTFLDLGTGTGHQAAELANMGFEVTATDLVPYAFEKMKNIAVNVEFLQDDILNSKLQKKFNYIFDRGCFHSFDEIGGTTYLNQVIKLLNPDSILFLKCFSKENSFGSRRFSKEDIYSIFSEHFIILEVKSTIYERDNVEDGVAKALFAVMKKK